MTKNKFLEAMVKLLVAAGLAVSIMLPAAAQAPALAMLDQLDKGQWEVRYRDNPVRTKICVRTGRELIQIRHPGLSCNRSVVEDGRDEVTVQYACRGQGYGRTHIRRETSSLVQIDSQGISGTRHFEFVAEARRVGSCTK